MTYDYELTLISQTYTEDEIGNQIPVETESVILCGIKSITKKEFYDAAMAGLRPELTFIIHGYEYSDDVKAVVFNGVRYESIRTYGINDGFEEMELTCKRVAADG